ncbi:formyl transferase [Paracidovorax avenae]|nr:formyl transferase [Paracidovorax avenae]
MMPRVTLLCSDGPHHLYLAAELLKAFGSLRVIVESGHDQAASLRRNGHYRAYLWTLYHGLRRKLFGYEAYRKRYFARTEGPRTWTALSQEPDVEFHDTPSINDPLVGQILRGGVSDAYIVMGTKKIGSSVLSAIPAGRILNIHGGYLPDYKGNHCFFFALHEGRHDRLGTTIHRVSAGLDAGDIVSRHCVQPAEGDNSETLYSRAEKAAIDHLVARLRRTPDVSTWDSAPQEARGRLYRMRDRGPLVELAHHLGRVWRRRPVARGAGKEPVR